MIGDIYENLTLRESITKQLLKLHETKTWEEIALALYGIIDDISTTDDACKENVEAFRSIVMKLQAKKNRYMYSPDGQVVKRVDEVRRLHKGQGHCPWCGLSTGECRKCFSQIGERCCTKCEIYRQGGDPGPGSLEESKLKDHLNVDGSGDTEDIDDVRPSGKSKKSRPPKKKKLTPDEYKKQISDPIRYGGRESKVGECVCHIYGMDDEKLIEFYKDVMSSSEHYASPVAQIQYPKDKAEVEREIRKRCLSVSEGLETDIEILVRNELRNDPIIPKDELFQNVLDGVKEDVRDKAKQLLPQVYNAVVNRYFESKLREDLTKVQQDTLDKMEKGKWYSSYDLQVSLNTLKAMSGRDYLTSKSELGSLFSPRTSIKFRIKETLTQHAQEELKRAGLFDKDSDYGGMLGEAVLALIELFAKQGHSGFSAALARDLFSKLSSFKPLTEITDDLDEWNDVTEYGDKNIPMWQSRRSPSLFSSDEGKTYWDIDEDYFFHTDEDGSRWSGGLSREEWDNRPIHNSKHIEKKEV